ncbi:hypothetical protein [Virgisporangium aurantiacum]|uniref:Lipoprotein n=1 Tax=Virgisporangium aurantiacum TaxID=175570 RepID=A0A8J3ZI23_9ACTN|nr:hypothetical protein [Virgisporangium aurantiacum]GIJ61808.1 hypothetical protein Vau01_093240 [Virgisporangium aurantiacum]
MRAPRFAVLLAIGLLGFTLVGCGADSDDNSGAAAPKRPALAPGEELVRYSRVGGEPLVDDELTVQPDGSFTVEQDGKGSASGKLTEAELAALEKVFTDNGFDKIDSDLTRNSSTDMDKPSYDIRYAGHSVTIIHGNRTSALQPIIDACDAFIASHLT